MSELLKIQIEELLRQGYGRRRIAAKLDISEWEARILINACIQNNTPPPQEKVAIKKQATNKPLVVSDTNQQKTNIKVGINSPVDEIPSKILIRPTNLKVACLSDIHYPYEDTKAEELALSFLKTYNPNIIVWNGDIFDCYSISSYNKDANKKLNIQDEIDYGVSRLEHWKLALPNTRMIFIMGNHEDRLRRLISNAAPSLATLRSTKFEEVAGLSKIGFECISSHQDLFIGSLMFYHGDAVRKNGGASGRAHFEQYGCSIIMGHCHRLSITYKRNKFGVHTIIENGTLCNFDVEYARFPDWQLGFTTIDFDGDSFAAEVHPIVQNKLIAQGKVYVQ